MATDPYDPDLFDWGEDTEGINTAELPEYTIEDAVRVALDVYEDSFDWKWVARADRKDSKCRLFTVKHVVPEESRKFVEEEYPGYTFVWDRAVQHHDHPVSHMLTELNELEMTEDLVMTGESYIDLFGNLGRARKYRKKALVLYDLKTPKDFIRYQAAEYDARAHAYSLSDLLPGGKWERVNNVLCTHALYYLGLDDIAKIVNTSKQRRLRALIHRHSDSHGYLNLGELEYWLDFDTGVVRQRNVLTGEEYTHPTMEALFHQSNAHTPHGGVAWTIKKSGGDSYIVDFVGCPKEICNAFKPLQSLSPESRMTYTHEGITVKSFLGWRWCWANTDNGKKLLTDHDLLRKLRRMAQGKVRNARLREDLFNQCKRYVNKFDIISVHSGSHNDIDVADLHHYVCAAMYMDVRRELEVAIGFHKENADLCIALNKYYEQGTMPSDAVRNTVLAPKRAFNATIGKILEDPIFVTAPGTAPRKMVKKGQPQISPFRDDLPKIWLLT